MLTSDVYENERLDTSQNAKVLLLIFVLVISYRRDKNTAVWQSDFQLRQNPGILKDKFVSATNLTIANKVNTLVTEI